MDIETLKNLSMFGVSSFLFNKKSNFIDTHNFDTMIIVVLIIMVFSGFIIYFILVYCMYKLSGDNILHAIAFIFTGSIYLYIVFLYWGLSGYKITKK